MNVTANRLRMSGGGATPFENTKSLLFDGTDDYVSTSLDCSSATHPNLSVSYWLKIPIGTPYFLGFPVSVKSQSRYIGLGLLNGGVIAYKANNSWVQGSSVQDGNWHNVVAVFEYDSSTDFMTVKYYLDGNTTPDLSAIDNTYQVPSLTGNLTIGSYNVGAGYFFPGNVDEVAVFDSALTTADITAIYNSGVPDDLSSLNPIGYWRNGDGDTYPTITDHGSGGNDGTMTNMTSGDIVADVP